MRSVHIFGESHVDVLLDRINKGRSDATSGAQTPVLGADDVFSMPIDAGLTRAVETGTPLPLLAPESPAAKMFSHLAGHVAERTARLRHEALHPPVVTFQESTGCVVLRFLSGPLEGHQYSVPARLLRARSLDAKTAASGHGDLGDLATTTPTAIEPRGNYGVAITWGDGHGHAIYSFDQIIELSRESE